MNLNIQIAKKYYHSMSEKNVDKMLECLSQNAILKSPLGITSGKNAIKESIIHFIKVVKNVEIKNVFGNDGKVVLNLDFSCEKPFGDFPSIVVMSFDDQNKISHSELFYDTTPFKSGEFDV
jgi:hypothetical protein